MKKKKNSRDNLLKLTNAIRDGSSTTLYTVYTVYIIQTALHCLNSSMYLLLGKVTMLMETVTNIRAPAVLTNHK